MKTLLNNIIEGKHGKPILTDVFYLENSKPKPIVVFSHGFKGFKDWGHFNRVAEKFAEAGFVFVKYSFSFNGTTPEHPEDFADLEAFGNNNISKELDDLGCVIDWIERNNDLEAEVDFSNLYLIGHSRGGGITILKANEDNRVKKAVTWAAVSDFERIMAVHDVEHWKREGAVYVMNARTNQQMPLYYQLCEDYYSNKKRFDILAAAGNLKIPFLIVHGTNDEGVPLENARSLHRANQLSQILLVEGAGHTFGAKHPFTDDVLPDDVMTILRASIDFLNK